MRPRKAYFQTTTPATMDDNCRARRSRRLRGYVSASSRITCLGGFLDRLWKLPSYHLPLYLKGIEKVGPFSIMIKQGMRVGGIVHDGTDWQCLELHVVPSVEAEVLANVERLPELVPASVAEALNSFGPGFGGEFGKQFGAAFADKFKEMLGVAEPQPSPVNRAADGRRYT